MVYLNWSRTAKGSVIECMCVIFSAYGSVRATKVISDRAGVSKGYGFVTFETEEEAKRLVEIVSSLLLSLHFMLYSVPLYYSICII